MRARRGFWQRLLRNGSARLGVGVLGIIAIIAISGPLFYPRDPFALAGPPMLWPGQSAADPLGTDLLGRDLLAGLIVGARVSLIIGIASTAAAVGLGVAVGALAGYYRGWVDDILMRVTEVFQTMPNMLLVLVLVSIFHPSLTTIVAAIAAASWPPVARVVRAQFLSLRQRDFVQSCVTIGMSEIRIILTQILPHCMAPVAVLSSILVATAILIEAALSFLGLGDPNVMSWGAIIGNARQSLQTDWYLSAIPGIAIVLTVLGVNLIGNGLSAALNPRSDSRT